ncbi:unnamed protein product [Leuciscus chuanchicus]
MAESLHHRRNNADLLSYLNTPGRLSIRYKACDDASRRIVLLSQTGVGKSSAGNTILGQIEFRSEMSTSSATSECSVKHAIVSGISVSVVDTPGLYHTEMKPEELVTEIMRSVYISSPGPHAFIIALRIDDRFTDREQQIPQMIEMMFGEEVLKYSIILFTHGDRLEDGETVETLIHRNCRLRDLVGQCGGRFHVFNNRHVNNREQVNDLLQKIDTMIEKNGGGHYSHQMIEDAERLRREEEERKQQEEKLKEEEQETLQRLRQKEKQRQEMEKQRQEMEKAIQYTEERIRAEFEGPPRFLQERLKSIRLRDEDRKRQEEERQEQLEREKRQNRGLLSLFFNLQLSLRLPGEVLMRKKQEEKQRQEEIESVIKETERRIRTEFESPPRW